MGIFGIIFRNIRFFGDYLELFFEIFDIIFEIFGIIIGHIWDLFGIIFGIIPFTAQVLSSN